MNAQQPTMFASSPCPNCEEPIYSGAAAQPHGCRLQLEPSNDLPDGVTGPQCQCPAPELQFVGPDSLMRFHLFQCRCCYRSRYSARFDVLNEGDPRR